MSRYFSYRGFRIDALNWNSAPLGVLILGGTGFIFFVAMTFGPKPYYWPNTHTLSYGNSPPIATRSGWMAIACMPFVFATAGKSNFITLLTGFSHERLQVFHRWISHAMYALALIHTFPFIIHHVWKGDMTMQWNTSVVYWTGVVALLAQTWLTFASISPLRNMAYEWFKLTHFLAAMVFMIFFFIHCDFTLSSWDYFVATGVVFSLTWLHRQTRIWFEHGTGLAATVTMLSNGFVKVSVPVNMTWRVGQHYFVRFLSLGLHAGTVHPFTACSLPFRQASGGAEESELVFYIQPRSGMTARLAKYAELHASSNMRVMLDGPYGGVEMQKIMECNRLLVIAGGSGAGWTLPLLIAFLRRLELAAPSSPSMRLILATRDLATKSWLEGAIAETLASFQLDAKLVDLRVEVFVTGNEEDTTEPKGTSQVFAKHDDPEKTALQHRVETGSSSDSSSTRRSIIHDNTGRPDLRALVASESEALDSHGLLGIFVCGPLSMQHDVSNAAASAQEGVVKQGKKEVYLHMEHFSWA